MKSLIVVYSYHHKNTEKVAQAIAGTLRAEVKAPDQVDPKTLENYNLVGFGSGVYSGKLSKTLFDLADKLSKVTGKKAFIFSTSGRTGKIADKYHKLLREKLTARGFTIQSEFSCGGFDTVGLKGAFGGIQKGRPSINDLKQATTFAQSLQNDQPSIMYIK
jgi:flavodoxin